MAVPHYTYLVLKMQGPRGIIIVKRSFELSDLCDKEFHKMAQTFGMIAEYGQLKGNTDKETVAATEKPEEKKEVASSQKQRNHEYKKRARADPRRTNQGLPPPRQRSPLEINN
jgi:hypothetical protein